MEEKVQVLIAEEFQIINVDTPHFRSYSFIPQHPFGSGQESLTHYQSIENAKRKKS